ncbi:peptidyl-tRNA hydrolase [Myxococcus phage Mx1]|nr:peptidyl-tRNA hydrolase [Myxococcus phage Mx1]
MAAQTIHAAGESSPGNLPEQTRAIALAAESEEHLLLLEAKLVAAGIPYKAIREPDAPWNGALMAIGIEPMPRAKLRPLLSGLPLLR